MQFRVLLSSRLQCRNFYAEMYETIAFPLLYGCEIWCLTLGEEHRYRMSDSRVFRRISPPKKNEVIVGWKNLHNLELHWFYRLQMLLGWLNQGIWDVQGWISHEIDEKNAYKFFVGKAEVTDHSRRPSCRWVDNIKIDLTRIMPGSVEWSVTAPGAARWGALLNKVINIKVP
jgi:hypothetical protein